MCQLTVEQLKTLNEELEAEKNLREEIETNYKKVFSINIILLELEANA